MKDLEALAKDALLHACYGKFDLVANVIPRELLFTGKPRRVKEWLIKSLGLKETDINPNTLRSWLHRYRKVQHSKSIPPAKQDWKEFEPTVVKSDAGNEKLIIKKVSNLKTL